ncbi:hypothetical protein [Nocardia sp. NRRL S-836]|uniref:hypothetical protein n=1 Tax=Nocardia sp. NRRL S-836 TaxID=1519492 RepID=UPI0006AEFA45|nr:hypothetical protein [Nocardia sp. NRRL S-836]KOV87568.1 hypothetical protein ADL03_06630 [Nocardia sp. NRRL S-836]
MDPADITTLDQLAGALDQLRRDRSLSLRGLMNAAAKLPTRHGRQPSLPHSTAGDLLNAKSVPEAETLETFLAACGIHGEEAQRPWLQALERVARQHQRRPPGAVRVRDARPRLVGVHAAIQVDPAAGPGPIRPGLDDELPPYVPRDFDADLRTTLTVTGQQGGFVLLVGESSVGKTRALFEAVRAVLPDWWLLHPGDAQGLREFATHPAERTVVWLDELQDYLDFAGGVPAGLVRDLIEAGVVLAATCWPEERSKRVALPGRDRPDPYANDRRLLGLADVLDVSGAFSADERRRAEDLAGTDRRIRVALDTPDAGFTQVMAAGPELIRHWKQAPAYAKAVITAALDARRVGAHAPLTREYLTDAVPGYLSERQVATAPADWLDGALDHATTLLHGATAALIPVAAEMGRIAGYRVADYLHQHALRVRRTEDLPDTAWHALIRHHHPDDTDRLAHNAARRGREHVAVSLYQQLIDSGSDEAAFELATMLFAQGQTEVLRAVATSGDQYTVFWLVDLMVQQAPVNALRFRADLGDRDASEQLVELLVKQGAVEVEVLRARANLGDQYAELRLRHLLAAQGQVETTSELLRPRADPYTDPGHRQVEVLRARAASGDRPSVFRLVDLMVEGGQVETAIELLRPPADRGDQDAAIRMVDLLARQGQLEELRARADNGDRYAAVRMVDVLARQGQLEELRARAASGDELAAIRMVDLLVEQGQVEVLRARVDSGDRYALFRLVNLLANGGQAEAAIELLRPRVDRGDRVAAAPMAHLLARQGQVKELRTRADSGDGYAAARLVELLAESGQTNELEREVAAGTEGAVTALHRARSHASNVRPIE